MEMAMAGSKMASLESFRSFCGDCDSRGFVRKRVGFADSSHERFYALRVRCGKKEKNLAGKFSKVQVLVNVQRNLVLLSRKVSTEQGVDGLVGDFEPEASVHIAISNPNVSQLIQDRIMKNLEDLQAEVESLNVKATKKKKDGSSSSSSSSSESSDSDMEKAVDMRALRKNSAKHTRAAVLVAAQASPSDNGSNSIPIEPVETFSQTHAVAEAISSGMLPSFHSAGGKTAGMAAAVSTSDDIEEQEPSIVAQIRALCSTANSCTSASTREIYRGGPIELKDTPSGRVIVDTSSTSLLSPNIPVSTNVSTISEIEVCTVGKCKRGGSQQILASLQGCIPESSRISVTSCKCMGKCKSAPNVRVKNSEGQTHLHSHVSVDDIDTLLELHFGVQSSASQSTARPILFARVDSGVAAA